jgi:hypothetical protein
MIKPFFASTAQASDILNKGHWAAPVSIMHPESCNSFRIVSLREMGWLKFMGVTPLFYLGDL